MVEVIRKTTRVVEAIAANGPAGVSDLARSLDIPKSTLHRYLATMEEEGLLINENGKYRVSLWFLDVGERIRRQNTLLSIARTELDDVTEDTSQPAHIAVEEHNQVVYLYESSHTRSFQTDIIPGKHGQLTERAAGQVLHTEIELDTTQDSPRNAASVDGIRDRGYASTIEAETNEIREIATPVRDQAGTVQAAVGITVDMEHSDLELKDLVERIQRAARIIELKADYS